MIPSKIVTRLQPGDRLIVETAGGGGHGDPAQRPQEQVAADVANGKIGEDAATRLYRRMQADD